MGHGTLGNDGGFMNTIWFSGTSDKDGLPLAVFGLLGFLLLLLLRYLCFKLYTTASRGRARLWLKTELFGWTRASRTIRGAIPTAPSVFMVVRSRINCFGGVIPFYLVGIIVLYLIPSRDLFPSVPYLIPFDSPSNFTELCIIRWREAYVRFLENLVDADAPPFYRFPFS